MNIQEEQEWEWRSFLNGIKKAQQVCLEISDRTTVWKHRSDRRHIIFSEQRLGDLSKALVESSNLSTIAIVLGENLQYNSMALRGFYERVFASKPGASLYLEAPHRWSPAQIHRLNEIFQAPSKLSIIWMNKVRFDALSDIESLRDTFHSYLDTASLSTAASTIHLESLVLSKACGEGGMDNLLAPFRSGSSRLEINMNFRLSRRSRPTVFTTSGLVEYIAQHRYRKVDLQYFGLEDDHCKKISEFLKNNHDASDIDLQNNDKITERGYRSLYQLFRQGTSRCGLTVDDISYQSLLRTASFLNQNKRLKVALEQLFDSDEALDMWMATYQFPDFSAFPNTHMVEVDVFNSVIQYNCGSLFRTNK